MKSPFLQYGITKAEQSAAKQVRGLSTDQDMKDYEKRSFEKNLASIPTANILDEIEITAPKPDKETSQIEVDIKNPPKADIYGRRDLSNIPINVENKSKSFDKLAGTDLTPTNTNLGPGTNMANIYTNLRADQPVGTRKQEGGSFTKKSDEKYPFNINRQPTVTQSTMFDATKPTTYNLKGYSDLSGNVGLRNKLSGRDKGVVTSEQKGESSIVKEYKRSPRIRNYLRDQFLNDKKSGPKMKGSPAKQGIGHLESMLDRINKDKAKGKGKK